MICRSQYRFTVDCESDYGGRIESFEGIRYGLPKILELFKKYDVKGLFFVSTEILPRFRENILLIRRQGHEIGSHGHFHIIYKHKWRAEADRKLSQEFIAPYQSILEVTNRYRAPKFNLETSDSVYSHRRNHVGLLKYSWLKKIGAAPGITDSTVFYMHPFDIVYGDTAPNLFCKLWYSKPIDAYKNLNYLLGNYSHNPSFEKTAYQID